MYCAQESYTTMSGDYRNNYKAEMLTAESYIRRTIYGSKTGNVYPSG
jgi:hypothetical protein